MPMFTLSFQTTSIAIAQIFMMGAVGYAIVRRGIMNEDGLKLLSFLSVNILFPLFIFYRIIHHFNPSDMPFWWGYPLINIGVVLAGLAVALFIYAIQRKTPKDEFLVSCALHNAGYIPLIIAMTMPLGAMAGKVYAAIIIAIIGFDSCLWSIGVWLLNRRDKPHIELRNLINPPLISMITAIVIVLLNGQKFVPDFIWKPVQIMGDGAMAISMLVIGGNLALTKMTHIKPGEIAGVVLIKLILLPLLALIFIMTVHLDSLMSFVLILQACMPTAVTLSIIGRHHGTKNQDFVNQVIFFTHLGCVVTLPIFLSLYGKWAR